MYLLSKIKYLLLGMVALTFIQSGLNTLNLKALDEGNESVQKFTSRTLNGLQGNDVAFLLTARCTRDLMGNKEEDEKQIERREWFSCNLSQVILSDLIFGEVTE